MQRLESKTGAAPNRDRMGGEMGRGEDEAGENDQPSSSPRPVVTRKTALNFLGPCLLICFISGDTTLSSQGIVRIELAACVLHTVQG